MIRRVLRVLRFIIEFIIAPVGTNLLGLALLLVVFLPLGILMEKFGRRIEGIVNFIGGGLTFGIDWFFRRPREFYAGQSLSKLKWDLLFDPEWGPRIAYLPAWMVGIIWMFVGLIVALIELIKG
jgi:hypothetical protein